MDVAAVIAEMDSMEHNNKWREAYQYAQPLVKDAVEAEVLWRLLRAYYRMGKFMASKAESEKVAEEGMQLYEKALQLAAEDFNVQKFCGIWLSWASELKGLKNKIEKSFVIKEHFEKALAIKSDALVNHLIGRWCFEVASVGWAARSIAKALFGTPPQSSYEEALGYFTKAEETSPNFYPANWLYLGRTQYHLSNKAEARKWLERVATMTAENADDLEVKSDGAQLMRKL